jgi:hypothetical protein
MAEFNYHLYIIIPRPLSPLERGALFEDHICEVLDAYDHGDIIGGGTYGDENGIVCCETQVGFSETAIITAIVNVLREQGAPTDTRLKLVNTSTYEVNSVRLVDYNHLTFEV